ncbi:MAG: AsmA family protein [Betaproteobacteria bacterium]
MRVVKWFAIATALLFVALALFVLFGLNTLKGPISRAVTNATGRELLIEGDLRAVWSWKHPRFRIERVTFANPDWGTEDYMFYADAIEAELSVLPLLTGKMVLPSVHLSKPEIYLEVAEDGAKNWIMAQKKEEQHDASRFYIRALTFDDAYLKYLDPGRGMDIAAELATRPDGVAFEASGVYNGMQAAAAGQGGHVMGLKEATEPYPIKAEARIGDTRFIAEGRVTNVAQLGELDLNIQVSGNSMSHLYDIVGIAFPETSKYATSGRLFRGDGIVRYEEFSGKVGESDLAGTLEVRTKDVKRPYMKGDLVSKVLNLADLGPLVGTGTPRDDGVLPDRPFDPERWGSVDADVKIRAGTIKRPKALPLDKLSTRIVMKDKVLTLDPLEFGVAGGRIVGPVKLDGQKEPIQADVRMRVQNLELAKLMPTLKAGQNSIGAVSGLAELTGHGWSVGEMLGSANGKIGVFVDEGEISRFLMELVAIDVWGIAKTKLKGDEPIGIRCAIVDLNVEKGLARTNAFVFDTSIVNVDGSGSVNLKTEEMDFTLRPTPKERSIASLNSPLYITGTFSAPKVGPDVGRVAAKGIGAVVMGVLNPILSVLPLMKEGKDKDSNCVQLIAEATKSRQQAARDAKSAAAGASAPKPAPITKEPPSSKEMRAREEARDERTQAPASQP